MFQLLSFADAGPRCPGSGRSEEVLGGLGPGLLARPAAPAALRHLLAAADEARASDGPWTEIDEPEPNSKPERGSLSSWFLRS